MESYIHKCPIRMSLKTNDCDGVAPRLRRCRFFNGIIVMRDDNLVSTEQRPSTKFDHVKAISPIPAVGSKLV